MVFNSYPFIFLFLPLTVTGCLLLGRRNPQWAAAWLTLASLFFYGWWNLQHLSILLSSLLFNFWAGQRINRAAPSPAMRWLTFAVTANLLLLGYFKYADFFLAMVNDLFSTKAPLLQMGQPVGISFFTFVQIAFLVDAYRGKAKGYNFLHYFLFTTYFPYIVAGPVVHHREMMPQLEAPETYRVRPDNVAVGLALFVCGLAKKLLIADNLAPVVSPVFNTPHPQFIQAWLGLLAFSLQLYFDFSGYSDMAIGVSRLLGIQLPLNFNSPYKAVSISDFWQRWHISLSRFLRDYLYIPLGGNRHGELKRYRNLLLTMLLGGLWHGANWTFVIWGGLHGLYLCVQHGWQSFGSRRDAPPVLPPLVTRTLTLLAVLIAWCFFRAPTVTSALDVLAGMAGRNGLSLLDAWNPKGYAILAISAVITFCLPNTQEIFALPANRQGGQAASPPPLWLQWSPTAGWGVITGLIFALCLLCLDREIEFIYVQF